MIPNQMNDEREGYDYDEMVTLRGNGFEDKRLSLFEAVKMVPHLPGTSRGMIRIIFSDGTETFGEENIRKISERADFPKA